jgi:hypothetical protein
MDEQHVEGWKEESQSRQQLCLFCLLVLLFFVARFLHKQSVSGGTSITKQE